MKSFLSANCSQACGERATRASRSLKAAAISRQCCARRRYSSALLATSHARPSARSQTQAAAFGSGQIKEQSTRRECQKKTPTHGGDHWRAARLYPSLDELGLALFTRSDLIRYSVASVAADLSGQNPRTKVRGAAARCWTGFKREGVIMASQIVVEDGVHTAPKVA